MEMKKILMLSVLLIGLGLSVFSIYRDYLGWVTAIQSVPLIIYGVYRVVKLTQRLL